MDLYRHRAFRLSTTGTTVALIPARGGSKAILRKNLVDLAGRPLIAWTIDAALACKDIDRVIVSTDDREIADVARQHGAEVPFIRPSELARDDTPMLDVVRHFVSALALDGHASVVLLQPTSPFRTTADLTAALELFNNSDAYGLVSIVKSEAHPDWMLRIDSRGRLTPLVPSVDKAIRRQDLIPVYRPNGAIYVCRASVILAGKSWYGDDTIAYEMPRERSLDIDEHWDLEVARAVLSLRPAP